VLPLWNHLVPKFKILRDTFGYESFRPGQEAIVDSLLAGRNVLAVMPTGSGKSLCFQIPALVKNALTIVATCGFNARSGGGSKACWCCGGNH
jgi:superfamily II DNA helicase RecQ